MYIILEVECGYDRPIFHSIWSKDCDLTEYKKIEEEIKSIKEGLYIYDTKKSIEILKNNGFDRVKNYKFITI